MLNLPRLISWSLSASKEMGRVKLRARSTDTRGHDQACSHNDQGELFHGAGLGRGNGGGGTVRAPVKYIGPGAQGDAAKISGAAVFSLVEAYRGKGHDPGDADDAGCLGHTGSAGKNLPGDVAIVGVDKRHMKHVERQPSRFQPRLVVVGAGGVDQHSGLRIMAADVPQFGMGENPALVIEKKGVVAAGIRGKDHFP